MMIFPNRDFCRGIFFKMGLRYNRQRKSTIVYQKHGGPFSSPNLPIDSFCQLFILALNKGNFPYRFQRSQISIGIGFIDDKAVL